MGQWDSKEKPDLGKTCVGDVIYFCFVQAQSKPESATDLKGLEIAHLAKNGNSGSISPLKKKEKKNLIKFMSSFLTCDQVDMLLMGGDISKEHSDLGWFRKDGIVHCFWSYLSWKFLTSW